MNLRQKRLLLIGLGACAVLGSCSARRVAYGFGHVFLLTAIDDAFKLDGAQKDSLRPRLRSLMAWHRHEELPLYAVRIEEMRVRLHDGLSPDDVHFARAAVEEVWGRLARHVAPLAGDFLMTVTPEQLTHFIGRPQKRPPIATTTSAAFIKKRTADYVRRLETWIGPVLPSQRALIERYLRDNSADLMARQGYYEKRQDVFLDLVRNRRSADGIAADILRFITVDVDAGAPAELLARTRAHGEAVIFELFRLSTAEQRTHLDKELAAIRDDAKALAAER